MKELKAIVVTILGIPPEEVTPGLRRADCTAWDSFNHLLLINEIETSLGIELGTEDIQTVQGYAELEILVRERGPKV